MAKSVDSLPWAIVLLVLTGGAIYKTTGSSAGSGKDEGAAPAGAVRAQNTGKQAPAAIHKDAIDALAEHFGVDISEETLSARAAEAARRIARDGAGSVPADLRAAVADLAADAATRPLAVPYVEIPPFATAADAQRFLRGYILDDRTQFRLSFVQRAMADGAGRRVTSLRLMTATVPDPIDSNVRWMFDPMVDALQRATADSNYVLDRFFIPDWDPDHSGDADHSSDPSGAHERWPGVVLFRHNDDPNQLLIVFLVSETATSGIHQQAFLRALAYTWMLQATPDEPIRILGPSFSGSIDSMVHALKIFTGNHAHSRIRIVSGGATRDRNRNDVEGALPTATFRATVLTDSQLLEGVAEYLLKVDPTLAHGRRLALLRESNTAYGRSMLPRPRPRADDTGPTAAGASAVDATADDAGTAALGDWWRGLAGVDPSRGDAQAAATLALGTALELPFPMHISRLRNASEADRQRSTNETAAPQRFHALRLDDPRSSTDQLPSLYPSLTSSSVELILANIFETLRRERITTIGLFATDSRDKLFLAQQLAKFAPSIRLFTIESDLLFVHPDYNGYVRGMLVGSTYPLFSQNQAWTGRSAERRQRQQFSMTNSEGVYNAALALLDYDVNGRPDAGAPALVDYRPPAPLPCLDRGCVPPVWISVVARDEIWPVAFSATAQGATVRDAKRSGVFVAPEPAAQVQLIDQLPARTRAVVHPSAGMTTLLLAVAAVCAGTAGLFWYWRSLGAERRSDPNLRFVHRAARDVRYQRIALSALVACGLPIAFTSAAAFAVTAWAFPMVDHAVYAFSIVSVALAIAAAVHSWCVHDERPQPPTTRGITILRRTMMVLAGLLALGGSVLLVGYVWTLLPLFRAPVALTGYAERALQMGDGVSPILPVLLLTAPIYCWAALQLWRAGGAQLQPVIGSSWFDVLTGEPNGRWRVDLRQLLTTPTRSIPMPWLVMLFVGFAFASFFAAQLTVVTIEPFAFSTFLVCCWLLTQLFVGLSVARALYAWTLVRRLLRGLAISPLADAFGRLPKDVFALHTKLSLKPPDRRDLLRALRQARGLNTTLDALHGAAGDEDAAARLHAQLAKSGPDDLAHIEYRPWSETTAFRRMSASAGAVMTILAAMWTRPEREAFLTRTRDTETKDERRQWCLRAEEFVAMLVTLVLRELLSRIIFGLFFVTIALVCVVAALSSFPIHPWQPLVAFVWFWMVVAAAAGLKISIALERDPIVSHLTGTPPNRITWNLGFVSKVVVYGLVPLLTLFATEFPELGGSLLRWVTPIPPLP